MMDDGLCTDQELIDKTTNMTFEAALRFLKMDYKIAREGWNGKGMWVILVRGSEDCSIPMDGDSAYFAAGVPASIIEPHIDMRTVQGTFQPGWLASQADILAEDWCVVI